MSTVRDPRHDQPLPTAGRQPVQDILIAAVGERRAYGIRKYGRPLETHNGRDALTDAWEEALDLATYLTQARLERGDQITTTPAGENTSSSDTPNADRKTRRDALHDLITRVGHGRAGADIAVHLANHLDAELADGDQAREQLAAAERDHNTHRVDLTQALGQRMDLPWPVLLAAVRAAREAGDGGKGRTASDVLVQHDVTRKAMCDALDAGYHLNWQQLVDTAQRSHDANAEWQAESEQRRKALAAALGLIDPRSWPDMIDQVRVIRDAATERADLLTEARDALEAVGQTGAHGDDWPAVAPAIRALAAERGRARRGEAEAVRAREAAEQGERRAMEQRQQMAAERFAWQERGDRAERRARSAETELRVLRSGLRANGADPTQIQNLWAQIRMRNGQWRETKRRAERAEATVRDYENRLTWETTCGEHAALLASCRDADEARWRTEATLTAVRKAVADAAECRLWERDNRQPCGQDHPAAIEAALGDPQPTAEPESECDGCDHPAHPDRECGEQLDGDDCPCANIGRPISKAVNAASETRMVRILVTGPTAGDADTWAQSVADLVVANYGQEMRLHVTIDGRPVETRREGR